MKTIDLLIQALPAIGGWPERVTHIGQDYDRELMFYGRGNARSGIILDQLAADHRKHGDVGTKITREQYEAALAAKNDGWIEWGGGKHPPVSTNTVVDVKLEKGYVQSGYPAGEYSWEHIWQGSNIIAYRLHKPTKSEQVRADAWNAYASITKADDESDLNECIGQDDAPVWNGDGAIPPVGYVCERSWAGDEWLSCEILFASNQIIVVKLKESGMEDAYNIGDVTFRPIRPEKERKREEAVKTIMLTGWCQAADEEIYDLVAAGKVPGMKVDG